MAVAVVRNAAEFEDRLGSYIFERSEESRAVRVGEKETSEQAAIVARYADLFSRAQLEALREAEAEASGEERERLYRLRKTCEGGLISSELVERYDELENRMLAARVTFKGEEMPLRTAEAQLAVLPSYADREELGEIQAETSAAFNPDRLELMTVAEELEAELSGIAGAVERSEEEKGISLHELSAVLNDTSGRMTEAFIPLRDRWFDRLLGPGRPAMPTSSHMSYMRRLSPLESTYTKERATEVCLATLRDLGFDLAAATNIKLDIEDRPQKAPRACVIPSNPPSVVHLITRAQGGLHDYQAFLHEAGHALHYGGVDPSLPLAFRSLARDHALTEIYSYIVEAISKEPEWHARYFGLSDEDAAQNAEATTFLEAILYRRYEAKLRYELEFWGALRRGRRHPRRLRGVPHRSNRRPLQKLALPLGHGRRLLLRRLPPSLGPLRPAPPLPDRNGRRGLVAQPRDRRVPARRLPRRNEALERGLRREDRLRRARHSTAPSRARRLTLNCSLLAAHSSSGLGHRPLTAAARVRIPYGP